MIDSMRGLDGYDPCPACISDLVKACGGRHICLHKARKKRHTSMPKAPFWIVNRADTNTAKVYVYGDIGYDIEAADFIAELRNLENEHANIDVHINTNGGCVFQGFTIVNAMRSSKANIETYVDGLAASMGSVIMLGGRKVHISKVACVMTHKASTVAIGGADSLRATATMLDGLETNIAAMYAAKTGLTPEQAKAKYLTGEDRWLTAQQALDEKLADSIYDAEGMPAIAIPENATRDQVLGIYTPTFSNHFNPNNQNNNMKKVTLSITPALAAMLCLASNGANADEAQVEAAIQQLSEKATRVDAMTSQVAQMKTAKETAEQQLAEAKTASTNAEVEALLNDALDKDKKITVQMKTELGRQYAGKPVELKALLVSMTGFKSVVDRISTDAGNELPEEFKGKTFVQLQKADLLDKLKSKHPAHFARLEKEWKESKD